MPAVPLFANLLPLFGVLRFAPLGVEGDALLLAVRRSRRLMDAANGNITSKTGVNNYVYNATTPSGRAIPHAPSKIGGQTLVWDENGNLSQGRGRTFVWDVRTGRSRSRWLRAARSPSFDYGPGGGRVRKVAPTPANQNCSGTPGVTKTLTFLDVELVEKPVCANGAWSTEATWTKNVHDDAKTVTIGTAAAKALFLHRDHLSSVRLVTRDGGSVEERSSFTPYGERTRSPSGAATTVESKGYVGERDDPETGLLYLNARYYDPEIGRFLSPDTIDHRRDRPRARSAADTHHDAIELDQRRLRRRSPGSRSLTDGLRFGRRFRLRRYNNRNERRRFLRLTPESPPPCKKLRRGQPMPPRNRDDQHAGLRALGYDRRLLLGRPDPPASRPGEHLKTPVRLRHRLKLSDHHMSKLQIRLLTSSPNRPGGRWRQNSVYHRGGGRRTSI